MWVNGITQGLMWRAVNEDGTLTYSFVPGGSATSPCPATAPSPAARCSAGGAGRPRCTSTVILTDGNGNPIAEVTADGSGNWTYTPSTPIANGTRDPDLGKVVLYQLSYSRNGVP